MSLTPDLVVYDADQVSIVFGPVAIDGFADGEFCSIEPGADIFTLYVGTDGKAVRSKTLRRDAIINVMTHQGSAANDALCAIAVLDRDAPNGAGIHSLWIRDRGGRALYTAQQCWIAAFPTVSFDREAKERAWKLQCAVLERFDGGN